MVARHTQDFHDLKVWQGAHRLALGIYRATENFPQKEAYGLVSQLRRCAVSIAANIAEGSGRGTQGDLARFLAIAQGSASELDYLITISRDLGYLPETEAAKLADQADHVAKMLNRLKQRVLADGATPYDASEQSSA